MNAVLVKYLPEAAVDPAFELIKKYKVHLKIVSERVTRHGDYRRMADGVHRITVNASLNKYRFLMTLIHEIAHLVAFEKYGRRIRPHGKEWKLTFQQLMLPFLRSEVYPPVLLPLLLDHFKNPKASSSTDARLAIAMKSFDPDNGKNYVYEVPEGARFRMYNGRVFIKGVRLVKRYKCTEEATGIEYLFSPNAEVELIPS